MKLLFFFGGFLAIFLAWTISYFLSNRSNDSLESPKLNLGNPNVASKKKEKQIEEKILSLGDRVIDTICDSERKCFNIQDVGSRDEMGNFFVARKIIPTSLRETAVTLALLQKPKELTWQNFNTKNWPIQRNRLFSVYNQVQVASILLGKDSKSQPPESVKVLLIGLGGGAVFSFLSKVKKIEIQTTAIEINPVFVEISKKWFNLEENGKNQIKLQDGLVYIRNAVHEDKSFDSILLDACFDDHQRPIICPVDGFLTKSAIQNLYRLLEDQGTLTVNLFTGQDRLVNEERVLNEFSKVFESCILIDYDPRRMLICFKNQKRTLEVDGMEILSRFNQADKIFDFSLSQSISRLNKL